MPTNEATDTGIPNHNWEEFKRLVSQDRNLDVKIVGKTFNRLAIPFVRNDKLTEDELRLLQSAIRIYTTFLERDKCNMPALFHFYESFFGDVGDKLRDGSSSSSVRSISDEMLNALSLTLKNHFQSFPDSPAHDRPSHS